MAKLVTYALAIAVGALLCWLYLGGCNNGKATQRLQDSLNVEKALNDTLKLQGQKISHKFDSLSIKYSKDTLQYNRKIDSLNKGYTQLKGKLAATKDSIFNLQLSLNKLVSGSSDPQLKDIVDRLGVQFQDANNQLFAIQINRDSSDMAKDNEIASLRNYIKELQAELKAFNDLLIKCTENASVMSKQLPATINKKKKANLLTKIATRVAALAILFAAIK